MLNLFDGIIMEAPEFKDSTVVAIPITAILLGPMNTQAGFNMFSNDRVNAVIKKMLNVWCQFLGTPASRSVLSTVALRSRSSRVIEPSARSRCCLT